MNKYIENASLKIIQRMEKNRHEYDAARKNYADTGYERFNSKMENLDKEYEELKDFLGIKDKQDEGAHLAEVAESERLRRILKNVKSIVGYMEHDFPINSDLIRLKELLKDV